MNLGLIPEVTWMKWKNCLSNLPARLMHNENRVNSAVKKSIRQCKHYFNLEEICFRKFVLVLLWFFPSQQFLPLQIHPLSFYQLQDFYYGCGVLEYKVRLTSISSHTFFYYIRLHVLTLDLTIYLKKVIWGNLETKKQTYKTSKILSGR